MGAGIPTTATYIILVAVAAPALAQLQVQPLVAHFFVFYYGVLADITPPVALAAYAASGIAGSNPFKTGNTAFRLGIAKPLTPFVFVYSPSLLLIAGDFTWSEFSITLIGAMVGIASLGVAFTELSGRAHAGVGAAVGGFGFLAVHRAWPEHASGGAGADRVGDPAASATTVAERGLIRYHKRQKKKGAIPAG